MWKYIKALPVKSTAVKQGLIATTTIVLLVTIGIVINNQKSHNPPAKKKSVTTLASSPTKAATDEAKLTATPNPTTTRVAAHPSTAPTKKPPATVTPGGQTAGATNSSDKLVIDDIEPVPNGAVITNTEPCINVKYHDNSNASSVQMMWKVDSGNWIGYYPMYHPCVFYGLSVGNHSVSVLLNDSNGNVSAIMTRNFSIVDTKPPEFREFIGGAQEGSVIAYNYQCVGWVYHDEVTGNSGMYFRWKLDSQDWTSYSTAVTGCVNFTNGPHTLQVQAKDINGNETGVTTTHFSVAGPGAATATPTQSPTSAPTPAPTNTPANTPTPEATAVQPTENPTPTGE